MSERNIAQDENVFERKALNMRGSQKKGRFEEFEKPWQDIRDGIIWVYSVEWFPSTLVAS